MMGQLWRSKNAVHKFYRNTTKLTTRGGTSPDGEVMILIRKWKATHRLGKRLLRVLSMCVTSGRRRRLEPAAIQVDYYAGSLEIQDVSNAFELQLLYGTDSVSPALNCTSS